MCNAKLNVFCEVNLMGQGLSLRNRNYVKTISIKTRGNAGI